MEDIGAIVEEGQDRLSQGQRGLCKVAVSMLILYLCYAVQYPVTCLGALGGPVSRQHTAHTRGILIRGCYQSHELQML